MEDLIKFLLLYSEVFDSDGNSKLCGREKCIELIIAGNAIQRYLDLGNEKTGMMNVENIKTLYSHIRSSRVG